MLNKIPFLKSIRGHKDQPMPILDDSQYWPPKRLHDFQNFRLKEMITYVYHNIPGYRKIFDKYKLTPKDVEKIEDLQKLPIIERSDLQNNNDFINKSEIYETMYTGGSSGDPLKYYESIEATEMRRRMHERGWRYFGFTGKEKLAVVSSAQGFVPTNHVMNISGDMSNEKIPNAILELKNFRPKYMRGYVSSVFILANYVIENKINLDFELEAINLISENLYDFQRTLIQKAFNCKVFEEYVCNDGGAAAWECEKHSGLHLALERSIIEVIEGRIIVTDLWNKAMPFIRYANGDLIEISNDYCKCGRTLPLAAVRGRANDILITPFGQVSPTYLMHNAIGIKSADVHNPVFSDGISFVQYVQKPGYKVEVNILKGNKFSEEVLNEFKDKVENLLKGMELNFKVTDSIKTTKSGKRRFIINEDKSLLNQYYSNNK